MQMSLHIIELIDKIIPLVNELLVLLGKFPNISLSDSQMCKNLLNLSFPKLFFLSKYLYFLISTSSQS